MLNMNEPVKNSIHQLFDCSPNVESTRLYFELQCRNGLMVCPHCSSNDRITAPKGKCAGIFCCGSCKKNLRYAHIRFLNAQTYLLASGFVKFISLFQFTKESRVLNFQNKSAGPKRPLGPCKLEFAKRS